MDEQEDALNALSVRVENLRGQLLTQARRITRLQYEAEPDDDAFDEEDEVTEMMERRRGVAREDRS